MKTTPSESISFDTALGRCALEYSERGLGRIHLPGSRFKPGRPKHVPPWVQSAVEAVVQHLAGGSCRYGRVKLDTEGLSEFSLRVYSALRKVKRGQTVSYGELARRIGRPGAARAVGRAVGANPWPLLVPCHRVLRANGGLGGFSAPGGLSTKRKLLAIEGIRLQDES
ncbi:MAG: MGMT family protein [Deltaproteobacteria bacterium]|nr:MGMT family protein [Deltaproteobacteria bacterium]